MVQRIEGEMVTIIELPYYLNTDRLGYKIDIAPRKSIGQIIGETLHKDKWAIEFPDPIFRTEPASAGLSSTCHGRGKALHCAYFPKELVRVVINKSVSPKAVKSPSKKSSSEKENPRQIIQEQWFEDGCKKDLLYHPRAGKTASIQGQNAFDLDKLSKRLSEVKEAASVYIGLTGNLVPFDEDPASEYTHWTYFDYASAYGFYPIDNSLHNYFISHDGLDVDKWGNHGLKYPELDTLYFSPAEIPEEELLLLL